MASRRKSITKSKSSPKAGTKANPGGCAAKAVKLLSGGQRDRISSCTEKHGRI